MSLIVAAVLGGAWLRGFDLAAQIVNDDELHTVGLAVAWPYWEIFTRFFGADACIPLSLICKVIADVVGLSEVSLRLPVLVPGVLALIVLPIPVWRSLGPRCSVAFAVLIAISPELVHYSRYTRPYGVAALLSTLALFAFFSWWKTRRSWLGIGYCLAAAASIYFHLLSALALAAPLPFVLTELVRSRGSRDGKKLVLACAGLALWTLGLLTLLLALPFSYTPEVVLGKALGGSPNQYTARAAAHILAGTWSTPETILLWSLAVFGAGISVLRRNRLAELLLFAIGLQLVGVWFLAPALVHIPIVYARYVTFVLPLILLFCAIAVSELGNLGGRRGDALCAAAAVLVALVLLLDGPLPDRLHRPNNFTNHPIDTPNGRARARRKLEWRLPFYRTLSADADSYAIIEAPWYPHWQGTADYHRRQKLHRKEVLIGFAEPDGIYSVYNFPVRTPQLKFRRFIDLHDWTAVVESGARYVILHRDLAGEIGEVASRGERAPSMAKIEADLRVRLQTAVYEDEHAVVFEIDPAAKAD